VATVCQRPPLGDKNATPPASTHDEITALLDAIVKLPNDKERQRQLKKFKATYPYVWCASDYSATMIIDDEPKGIFGALKSKFIKKL